MSQRLMTLLTVGKLPAGHTYLETGWALYAKRLSPRLHVRLQEVPEATVRPSRTTRQIQDEEAETLAPYLAQAELVVALHETGRAYSSEQFAKALAPRLEQCQASSPPAVSLRKNPPGRGAGTRTSHGMLWIVGGPQGLAPQVLERADWVVSLSPMTLPHPLVRLVWIEQIYRAMRILHNEPYHK